MNKRKSGILIHPTSFMGPYGCGDLGDQAFEFLDWMKAAGQRVLQILPLGPTGYGDSPYQAFSAFAGTPYIISIDKLVEQGYLSKADAAEYPEVNPARVDYGMLYVHNFKMLRKAHDNAHAGGLPEDYYSFCKKNAYWLDDYALFMAIKDDKNGASWYTWEMDIRTCRSREAYQEKLAHSVEFYKFVQWEFFNQWHAFKEYANKNDISIIGDAPIFVSYDSSDAWANQHLFYLDAEGTTELISGVPPDYFSETGQLWGNPIYRWDLMKENGYKWWKQRISHTLEFVDSLRIDHFRGFKAYWAIPHGEETAVNGEWTEAQGYDFFNSLKNDYGDKLNQVIIAEDLGVITPDIKEFRDHFDLAGMKVVEFANFPSNNAKEKEHIDNFTEDEYLPENFIENCLAYPGTHDNDTIIGWFQSLSDDKKKDVLEYFKINDPAALNYAMIESIVESKADTVIFLMQDVLELTSDHRMNMPSTCGSMNWSWRLTKDLLKDEYTAKLYNLSKKYGRL